VKISPLIASVGIDLHPEPSVAAATRASGVAPEKAVDPERMRAAREFEQIFIRKMLSSLEKTGRASGGSSVSSGSDMYSSMVVSALAEAVSKGGGVGLAEVLARTGLAPSPSATNSHPASASVPQLPNENDDLAKRLKKPSR